MGSRLKDKLMEKAENLGGWMVNKQLQAELTSLCSKDLSVDLGSWLANKKDIYVMDRKEAVVFAFHTGAEREFTPSDGHQSRSR